MSIPKYWPSSTSKSWTTVEYHVSETRLVWTRSLSLMSYQTRWGSPVGVTSRATRP